MVRRDGPPEAKRLKTLVDQNTKLTRLLADDLLGKKW
jgi:hypothetical protein